MDAAEQAPSIPDIFRSYLFRFGIYAFITLLVFESVYAAIGVYGPEAMGAENGPIEMAQVLLAIIGAVGLFAAACWSPIGRSGWVMCGAVVAYAAARESDLFFETLLFDDAYKWVVGLPMAVLFLAIVIVDRRRLVGDNLMLMRHPAATMFGIAGVFLCFVCQIIDRPEMWAENGTDGSVAITKALIEEYCELFAYLLIAFSGIESALLGRRRKLEMAERAGGEEIAEIHSIAA